MRVQRTRVLLPAVVRRSPLTRRPLGEAKNLRKHWFILICLVLLAAYCAYACAFHAWVTATPVSAEMLHRSQALAKVWSAAFIFAISLIVCVAWRMIWLYKQRRFSVAQ